jgi:hypothetical protein
LYVYGICLCVVWILGDTYTPGAVLGVHTQYLPSSRILHGGKGGGRGGRGCGGTGVSDDEAGFDVVSDGVETDVVAVYGIGWWWWGELARTWHSKAKRKERGGLEG